MNIRKIIIEEIEKVLKEEGDFEEMSKTSDAEKEKAKKALKGKKGYEDIDWDSIDQDVTRGNLPDAPKKKAPVPPKK